RRGRLSYPFKGATRHAAINTVFVEIAFLVPGPRKFHCCCTRNGVDIGGDGGREGIKRGDGDRPKIRTRVVVFLALQAFPQPVPVALAELRTLIVPTISGNRIQAHILAASSRFSTALRNRARSFLCGRGPRNQHPLGGGGHQQSVNTWRWLEHSQRHWCRPCGKAP